MRYLVYYLSILLVSCSVKSSEDRGDDPFSSISDITAREILKKAIEKAGGLEAWKAMDTLSFTKRSVLRLEDSTVESDVTQIQTFIFRPHLQVMLTWTRDSIDHQLFFDGSESIKFENGEVVSKESGMGASLKSAFYTMSMPFKLVDDAHLLSYMGQQIIDGDTLETIQVNYHYEDPETDIWWYYFHPDGRYWGSKVFHEPTYALIKNDRLDQSTPFLLQSHRLSYRADSVNDIKFLRAEFWYSDYQVK